MIPVALNQLALDCEGKLLQSHADELASAVTIDTRRIAGGELFVAIRGERVDGAALAAQALEAGAVGVLTSDPEVAIASGADSERLIVVPDVLKALGDIARANLARVREQGDPLVVAVTGSVGKTTTKDLLAKLLAYRGPIIAPPGSFNNEVGLPLTVLRADAATATLVLEMGADHVGNIDYLTSIAQPDVSVVLIVARAHLGEFGGIDNVQKAKSELVLNTREGGVVVLNADDARVMAMADLARGPVVTFSALGKGEVSARDIEVGSNGCASFTLTTPEASAHVTLGLVGAHHVANALAAATVARALGRSVEQIAGALTGTTAGSPHRMDVFTTRGAVIIDDSYNANPDSMRAGIRAAGSLAGERRTIAVLGEMLELGDSSESEHADLAPVLADAGIDVVIAVGRGTEALAAAAYTRGIDVVRADDPDVALMHLEAIMGTDDVVLIKGSNGSGVWRVADALRGEEK